MYNYRQLTVEQQHEIVEYRKQHGRPWHSPPHWEFIGGKQFLISAACYEHVQIIGASPERMTECETTLLELCEQHATMVYAWCILPNHYHVLLKTENNKQLLRELGKMHGRLSYQWNCADDLQGRKICIAVLIVPSDRIAISGQA